MFDLTSEEEEKRRLDICKQCKFYRPKARFFWGLIKLNEPQCGICKCLLQKKVIFEDMECPSKEGNKWQIKE